MDFQRQSDLFDPSKHQSPVTIIGAGGIGSPTAIALAKLGIKDLRLVDDDLVSEANEPNQMFPLGRVGDPKAVTVQKLVNMLSGIIPKARVGRFNGSDVVEGVMISAVDSMASRREIWERVKYNAAVDLFIDGRMGGEVVRLYTVRPCQPDDVARYEATLCESSETAPLACGSKAIIYVGFMIAALITRAVAKWITKGSQEFETVMHMGHLTLMQEE